MHTYFSTQFQTENVTLFLNRQLHSLIGRVFGQRLFIQRRVVRSSDCGRIHFPGLNVFWEMGKSGNKSEDGVTERSAYDWKVFLVGLSRSSGPGHSLAEPCTEHAVMCNTGYSK